MPQKQNPDALELIRAKSARLIANANSITINMKGLSLAYNKDLQETQQPIFDSAITALSMLQHASGFMREVQFDFPVMEAAAQSHFMNAFAAATYLASKGVPFRRAHEIIGAAVRLCMDKGCELQDLPLTELQGLHPAFAQDFYAAVQLNAVLDCHDVIGGTARARVKQALATASDRISLLKGEAHAHA
jgi:argininosuccinate lyase